MRLINANTLKLESFFQANVPPYAILSHTWGPDEEEITFQDFQNDKIDKPGVGRFKLKASCQQAGKDGLKYIWNDTCCIDKANSTELGEAINSMFKWYERADRCYAFLQDVSPETMHLFPRSRWFTRGWTLQELLAPREVAFYSNKWRPLGSRRDLAIQIEQATSIPRHFLIGVASIFEASIAQRMCWAANRQTKRPEDIAYSLLGLFGVTMPMIYGEGDQAFFRLQEEIMRRGVDDSILAWGLQTDTGTGKAAFQTSRGVLAKKPYDFKNCGLVVSSEESKTSIESFNALGGTLRIQMRLHTTPSGDTFGLLGSHLSHDPHQIIGIPLRSTEKRSYNRVENVSARVFNDAECQQAAMETINIRKEHGHQHAAQRRHGFYIDDHSSLRLEIIRVHPGRQWYGKFMISAVVGSETGKLVDQQTWVRLRAGRHGLEKHLVLLLELQAPTQESPVPTPHCYVMASDATDEAAWDDEAEHNALANFMQLSPPGKQTASLSAEFHIRADISLERIGTQPMFVVKIVEAETPSALGAMLPAPSLQVPKMQRSLVDIIKGEDETLVEMSQSIQQAIDAKGKAKASQTRLDTVNEQIRALEAEREDIQLQLDSHLSHADAFTQMTTILVERRKQLVHDREKLEEDLDLAFPHHAFNRGDNASWHHEVAAQLLNDLPADIEDLNGLVVQQSIKLRERLLVRAILHAKPGIVRFAIEALGAKTKSIKFNNDFKMSPLEIAASRSSLAVVRALLAVETSAQSFTTALHLAARNGNLDVVRPLLHIKSDANETAKRATSALQQALEGTQNIATVQILLEEGADLPEPGFFALHKAALRGNTAIVTLLLDRGADLTLKNKDLWTPLACAASSSVDCVKLLLDRGAVLNPDPLPRLGLNIGPLHTAALFNKVEIARLLLDRGADINATMSIGQTPLWVAADSGHSEVTALLLEKGADTGVRTSFGKTPLLRAAESGHHQVVTLLLKAGGDTAEEALDKTMALSNATVLGHDKVIASLLDYEASVNGQHSLAGADAMRHVWNVKVTNSVAQAAEKGQRKTLERLLNHKAVRLLEADLTRVALNAAMTASQTEIVAYLEENRGSPKDSLPRRRITKSRLLADESRF